jgi:hypothetical protein
VIVSLLIGAGITALIVALSNKKQPESGKNEEKQASHLVSPASSLSG